MKDAIIDILALSVGSLIAIFGVALYLAMFVVMTAPFWGIGLICLWVVGLI